jgi:hypothetical protein
MARKKRRAEEPEEPQDDEVGGGGASGGGDDPGTAFPAAAGTPGQAASRSAYEQFQAVLAETAKEPVVAVELGWRRDYLMLRGEGWDWRRAAYIAWAASPANGRWPPTQAELATHVLGLKSDRVVRKWRDDNSKIDERVAALQVEPLFKHRRDAIDALVRVACDPDPKCHADRELFFQMTGDISSRGVTVNASATASAAAAAQAGVDLNTLAEWSDDELDRFIANATAANGSGAAGAKKQDGNAG